MMTWEYQLKPVTFTDLEDCTASLNRLGRDGWELVAIQASGSGKDGSWPCGQKIKTAGKTRGYPIPA
jgi:hypothetical protein